MTEERIGSGESGDQKNGPNDLVGSPGDHHLMVAPNLHLMGHPIQDRCVTHHWLSGIFSVEYSITIPSLVGMFAGLLHRFFLIDY